MLENTFFTTEGLLAVCAVLLLLILIAIFGSNSAIENRLKEIRDILDKSDQGGNDRT